MKAWTEAKACGAFFSPEGSLKMAEEASRPGKSERHGTELAQQFVPLVQREPALARRNGAKKLSQAQQASLGQGDG
eukprot:scaffold23366_cov215-Cylindrotheca_fusiformis.AAC.4